MMPLLSRTLPKISSGSGIRPHGGGLRSSATCNQLAHKNHETKAGLIRTKLIIANTHPSCCHSAIPFNEESSTLSTLSPITLCKRSANSSFSAKVPGLISASLADQPMTAQGKSSIELPEGSSLSDKNETGNFFEPA